MTWPIWESGLESATGEKDFLKNIKVKFYFLPTQLSDAEMQIS